MKIKVVGKYVTGLQNSTKEEPIKLILADNSETVWNDVGLHLIQRKFPDMTFTTEVIA